jgi:general secretion pathway protein H
LAPTTPLEEPAKTRISGIGERPSETAGFTLIELLVALGILALVLATALPMLPGAADRTALRSATSEVTAALREARGLALATGRSATVTIDTARHLYRVGDRAGWHALPAKVAMELYTATRERIDAVSGDIRYFADGSSTGGAVRLVQGKAVDEIRVDWLTGRVSSVAPSTMQQPDRNGLLAH